MKIYKYLLISLTILTLSCSEDDPTNPSSVTYQPIGATNYWNYKVETAETSQNDSLYILEPVSINNKTYHKIKANSMAIGFYSTTLSNNAIREADGKIYVTGAINFNLGSTIPLNIALADFIMLDGNATLDQQLSLSEGVVEQDVQGYPLKLTYELRSIAGQTVSSYTTPSGVQYSNVKSVKVKLNLKITTIYDFNGFLITVPLLNPQDVIVSERYYAENIGMVYSSTRFAYELQDFSEFNVELPIPQSASEIQYETLQSYDID